MKLLKYTMKWLKRTKPREGNELVSSDESQDKLEKASDTSMPTNRSDSLENKPTGSPDTTPRKLAIKLAFTLPASCYATMAITKLLKTSTSTWRIRESANEVLCCPLEKRESWFRCTHQSGSIWRMPAMR
ncbi:unnamed protein product [Urochloa humidicola]